jgi:murein hydrolase activator
MSTHHRTRRSRSLLVAAMLAVGLGAATAHSQETERAEAEAELVRITERLNDLSAWLIGAERKRTQWQREIQTNDRAVARLARDVEAAGTAVGAVHAEITALHRERDRLLEQRAEQAQHIGRHLTSAYRLSGEDFFKLLLNQQSPETFDRMVRYHRYFSEARLETLHAYRATLAELAGNEAALEAKAMEAERRQAALETEQAALVRQRDQRRALLERLARETEDKTAERDRLTADRNRLDSLLTELARRAQVLDGRDFAARKGSLPWPLRGRVLQSFGQPRAEGRLAWHGLLVEAEEGTPITAVFRGRVVFADWLRGFGLLAIVDHGSGYMTLYGHADVLTKRVGDWVEGGEVIARAGRSGGRVGSGLYFEVRQDGRAADPIVWLARR